MTNSEALIFLYIPCLKLCRTEVVIARLLKKVLRVRNDNDLTALSAPIAAPVTVKKGCISCQAEAPKRKVRKKQEPLYGKRKERTCQENIVLEEKGQTEEPRSGMKTRDETTTFSSYFEKPSTQSQVEAAEQEDYVTFSRNTRWHQRPLQFLLKPLLEAKLNIPSNFLKTCNF